MQRLCTRCGATFEGEGDVRCPRCLRKTSVVAADEAGEVPRTVRNAWPEGKLCPVCLSEEATENHVYFEVLRAGTGIVPGSRTSSVLVSVRCCRRCRSRVAGLHAWRLIAAPFILAGLVSLVFALSIRVLLVPGVLAFAVPLTTMVVANRRLRRALEITEVFRRAVNSVPDPGGLIEQEHWKLLAAVPESARSRVVDGAELVAHSWKSRA